MITQMQTKIDQMIDDYCRENNIERIWKPVIVRFADAESPMWERFKELVLDTHLTPQDLLAEAAVVLSYFLPFVREVAISNVQGERPSETWARAYVTTNKMAAVLNEQLTDVIEEMGYTAAIPVSAGTFDETILKSDWSQRHIAWLAGHGTFGINNMLISDLGSCGRYFSVVTSLPVTPGQPVEEERCLYKRDGSCHVCIDRCPVDAFSKDGFARADCFERLLENRTDKIPGAQVCGKCDVGLPCSFRGTL